MSHLFIARVNLANQSETYYKSWLLSQINSPHFHIWFDVLQNAASKAKSGERLHVQSFESACTAMARYFGLAPEIQKDESDKPVGRMKCVACGQIKTGSEEACLDCEGTVFVEMEPGEMGWL